MGFGSQVVALLRKDWRIFKANRKASCCEVLFPIIMGILTGVFILLIQLIQNSFGEYQNIDTTVSITDPSIASESWIAFISAASSPYALALASYLHPFSNLTQLSVANFTAAFDAYQQTRDKQVYFGIEANSHTNFTLYEDTSGDGRWSAAFSVADLFTSNASASYPQTVKRYADHESFVTIPNLRAIFSSTGCMLLIYAFIPSLILTGGRLVEEKRVKVRESLKVMGLSDSAYILSNFISSVLRMAIGTGLISIALAAFKVIEASSIPQVFLVGMLFAISLIAWAQIMPSLFSASIWSNVMCIILLSGGAAISSLSTGWEKPTEIAVCLLSPAAFYYAILPYMAQGTVTLLVSTTEAAVMLAVDTVLYLLIGNYIYAISPGEFGVPKHPLFFIRWIWHSNAAPAPVKTPLLDAAASGNGNNNSSMTDAERLESRVVIKNLMKYFGEQREQPAVDHFSLKVKRGEILALLGHNGAGKTTTISILTGMITPTAYDEASVDGLDISDSMDAIRHTVGLCPQFDVLFNDLTAREHLELFAEIKGDRDESRINRLMSALELPDTDQKSSTFSGGTKRRLSVGNALVGGGTLIYLDEPSSGMDPLSRRKMWDLLKGEKAAGKTIILCTHFMEEADYLGDRIAIMSRGRLYCCNTSAQLKNTYGVGYYLTLVKRESSGNETGRESRVHDAVALVKKFVPEVELHHESSGEAQLLLPIASLSQFGDMLTSLEGQITALGFHSYGLSMNTLEDVFVSISEKEEAAHASKTGSGLRTPTSNTNGGGAIVADPDLTHVDGRPVEEYFQEAARVSPRERFFHQLGTVFWRKVLMLRRTRRMQLMIILFPIFFIVTAFLVIQPQAVSQKAYEGEGIPDFNDLTLVNFCLRDTENNALVLAAMQALYKERYPDSSLRVLQVDSMADYGSGSYIPMSTLSFASGFKTPDVAFGLLAHTLDFQSTPPVANYTFVFHKKFSPAVGLELLAMYNTALEIAAGNSKAPLLSFTVEAFPQVANATPAPTMPPQATDDSRDTTYNFMQVGLYTVIAVVQLVANCAIPVADEMQRQIYHVNRLQGMSAAAYFIGNLLFDFLCCLFPLALMVIMIFLKQIGAFYSFVTFWVILAGLLFCVHVVLQAYCLVVFVRGLKPVTYTGILHGFNLLLMGWPYMAEVIMNSAGVPNFAQIKPFILALTPPAAFYHILDNASDMTYSNTNAGYIMTLTGTVATAWGFIFMVVELLAPITALYWFANGRTFASRHAARSGGTGSSVATGSQGYNIQASTLMDEKAPLIAAASGGGGGADAAAVAATSAVGNNSMLVPGPNDSFLRRSTLEDPDVVAERLRVTSNTSENMVAAVDLVKMFSKLAVNHVTFGIRRGECFGLLGPNGAGKSTTCGIMLRDIPPTSGDVHFPYANVTSDTPDDEAFQHARIGVCMQGDSLWEFLSAAEHVDQYLRLRLTTLYEPEKWRRYIDKTIAKVYLADAGQRFAGGYSGGMKRKLLVCIAMYTGALSVFLDEPSTGMDPFSRRALWSVILEALSHERSVLLTTHSMEEADAVCSRISIITSGQLRCIGSSQHLKNRFGSGYVLTVVHETDANPTAIDETIVKVFPGAEVQEILGFQRRYALGKLTSLATAFKQIQALREQLRLQQYSISQTVSLEQIFLAFVGTAKEGETVQEVPNPGK